MDVFDPRIVHTTLDDYVGGLQEEYGSLSEESEESESCFYTGLNGTACSQTSF